MLRRFACLLLSVVLVFSICACSKNKKAEQPVTTGFECDVDVQYGDMDVKGHLTRSTAGMLRMDVTEPESLKGLSMEWNGEDIVIKLYGMSFGVKPENIPQSALGKGMLKAFDSAFNARENGKETKEGLLIKGSTDVGEFEIVSDPVTGDLLSMNIPSLKLAATFSNFTLIKKS